MTFQCSWRIVGIAAALLLGSAGPAQAEVRLPSVLSDHMLLQQGVPVRVWGWAGPGRPSRSGSGAAITLPTNRCRGIRETGKCFWSPRKPAAPFVWRSGEPIPSLFKTSWWETSGWLRGSPIWRPVRRSKNPDEEIAQANFPQDPPLQGRPQRGRQALGGRGREVAALFSPVGRRFLSPVGYYFARHLHRKLGHPVGVIQTAWGGNPGAGLGEPASPRVRSPADLDFGGLEQVLAEYPARQKEHLEEVARLGTAGPRPPRKAANLCLAGPVALWGRPRAGSLQRHDRPADALRRPRRHLVRCPARWYQGENNVSSGGGRALPLVVPGADPGLESALESRPFPSCSSSWPISARRPKAANGPSSGRVPAHDVERQEHGHGGHHRYRQPGRHPSQEQTGRGQTSGSGGPRAGPR